MLGRADEIKTQSIQTIGNVGQTINNWLAENKNLTIIDIKISESKKETTILIVFQDNEHLTITRPEVSI